MRRSKEQISSQKLMDDLVAVIANAEELLNATASQTDDRMTAVRAKAEKSLKAAKMRISNEQQELLEQAKTAVKEADTYVHENPWQAAGIAAAIGILIGALISRR